MSMGNVELQFERSILEYIIAAAAILIIPIGFIFAGNFAASIPDVHVSHSTNECVQVINYTDQQFSCENMPERYTKVWVK